MTRSPIQDARELWLDGEKYEIAPASMVSGARQWRGQLIGSQEASAEQEAAIPLDFVNGGGFTFQGLPGTYENASGWDASSRGRIATWPEFSSGEEFDTDASLSFQAELGGYLYVVRGRYVLKYPISATQGATWAVASIHDLGSDITCPGKPAIWRGKLYVPRIDSTGALQRFHRITTQATEVAEVQTIIISGTPTGGTYSVTFDSKTVTGIAYNADQAAVQAALRTIAGLEKVTVVTTGSTPNYTHTVTLTAAPSALASASPPQMTSSVASLTGGTPAINHATSTPGTTDTWDQGPSDRLARAFVVTNKGFLRAAMDTAEIRTCDDDPLTSGDWAPNTTDGYLLGDTEIPITELLQYLQYTIGMKEDGPFSFDETFYSQPELPDLSSVRDTQNGVGSSYFQGKMLMPHRSGLILWDFETWMPVGPTQEDGLEGDRTEGWGRVAATVPYGRVAYVVANDNRNGVASLWSLAPGGETRPLQWHSHLVEEGLFESLLAFSVTDGSPVQPGAPATFSSDNANGGTIDWTNPGNAADEDDSYAYAGVGTTKYLRGLNPSPAVPSDATILGILVRVKKSLGVA